MSEARIETGAPKRLLVTGASRGIGLALVTRLQASGQHVIAACRDPRPADELQALGVPVVALDVTDAASLAGLAARVSEHTDRLDVLVNNAGIKQAPGFDWEPSAGPLELLEAEAMAMVLRTNVIGPTMVTRALFGLLRQPGGIVANISSQLGSFAASVDVDYAYNCAKAALNMVTVTMDRDIGGRGVRAVSINPGWIRTAMGGDEAPLDVVEATRDIASLLLRLDATFGGRFVDRQGTTVPW